MSANQGNLSARVTAAEVVADLAQKNLTLRLALSSQQEIHRKALADLQKALDDAHAGTRKAVDHSSTMVPLSFFEKVVQEGIASGRIPLPAMVTSKKLPVSVDCSAHFSGRRVIVTVRLSADSSTYTLEFSFDPLPTSNTALEFYSGFTEVSWPSAKPAVKPSTKRDRKGVA